MNERSQEGNYSGMGGGPAMFESYGIQPVQPITATNQNRSQKLTAGSTTNQFSNNKKGGSNSATQSFVAAGTKQPSKSLERNSISQHTQHTGQKSVTNKYTKILAGVDDFDSNPPQIHVPAGISSATNKIKKSFNFDTAAIGSSQQEMNSIDHVSAGNN